MRGRVLTAGCKRIHTQAARLAGGRIPDEGRGGQVNFSTHPFWHKTFTFNDKQPTFLLFFRIPRPLINQNDL